MFNKQVKSMSAKHQVVVSAMEKGNTGRRVYMYRDGRGALSGKQSFRPEEPREEAMWASERRAFQAQGTARAKALRWEYVSVFKDNKAGL